MSAKFRIRRKVYLDNNATTMVSSKVRKVMGKTLRRYYGNPSSNYQDAKVASSLLESSRKAVAESVGALSDEIIFTSSASESNNQILFSCIKNAPPGRNVIVASPIEHSSILKVLDFLEENGTVVRYCPVDEEGRIVFDALSSLVDNSTLLVCIMYANGETGVIQDIPSIAELTHQNGAWLMSDCVQALGKIPVNVKEIGVDFASFSAHKIYGPKGVGATYVRPGLPISPFIHGGHQENGLRGGTESLHNIAGFAEACRNIPQSLFTAERIRQLRDNLALGIQEIMPSARFNTSLEKQWNLGNTLSVHFPGFDSTEAIGFLDYYGISVSAGSACNTHSEEPSAVLKAIGLSDEESHQTLRLSLSDNIPLKHITYTLSVLRDYLGRKSLPVTMMHPSHLDENLLFDENIFIIDIRRRLDRKIIKGLPRSHETSFSELRANFNVLPRNKNLLVVCQFGFDNSIAAYYLRSKGFKSVSFVGGGAIGWKNSQPSLYNKYADIDKQPLLKK